MRRFFAPPDSFADGIVTLDADETRHLRDVLRLRPRDRVAVFDGAGGEFACDVVQVEKRNTILQIVETVEPASPESRLHLTLATAMLKHDRFDLVIQKAVELGVTTLVPLDVIRFDVRGKDAVKRIDRWRRIAFEATKQCGRARLMDIAEPQPFTAVMTDADPSATVMFSEREGGQLPAAIRGGKVTAFIGPVGGWDDSELKAAQDRGTPIVTLGGRILRAETAAISIAAILQHRFGDLN
jgi:16S rRNA (uracil1498-N3)-methyltransferase